jgi:hypothetical protein
MVKTFHNNYETVFKACKTALKELEIDVDSSSKSTGIINSATSGSLFSWGENVNIAVTEISRNKTKVSVKSKSKAQLFSWGTNTDNEEKIIETIEEILNS